MKAKIIVFITLFFFILLPFSDGQNFRKQKNQKQYMMRVDQMPYVMRKQMISIKNPTQYKIYFSLSLDANKWYADSIFPNRRKDYTQPNKMFIELKTGNSSIRYELRPPNDYRIIWNGTDKKWDINIEDREEP